MVKNLPANAGDTGSILGLGRSHMLWGQNLKLAGIKTKTKCTDGEWGEEDYHDLPYGQLCLLSKGKNRWVKKQAGNKREKKGIGIVTKVSG